jgi:hypothetical protein
MSMESASGQQDGGMTLTRVQQWVATTVVLMLGMGIAAPLAGVSVAMDEGDRGAGSIVGIWIMSGLWGVATMFAVLVVHQHKLLSAWLLLGLLPAALALPWVW